MAGRVQQGYECTECGHRVEAVAPGRQCPECGNSIWDRVVTARSTARVKELLARFDWGCIGCDTLWTDERVADETNVDVSAIDEHAPCPGCGEDLASADDYLLEECLPDSETVSEDDDARVRAVGGGGLQ